MDTKKRNKTWDPDTMNTTVESCLTGSMSIYAASRQYNLPRTTLSQRVRGNVKLDASTGRPTALSESEEESIVHYVKYMHSIRFPDDRSQVISIAWAIDIKTDVQDRIFKESGPSLKWWRGFKNRHKELCLRKTETIDAGRFHNATEEIVNKYFDVLEETVTNLGLAKKPHLIFNCDESSLVLNRSAKKVLIPRSSKYSHTISTANSQHASVLCCVSAAGYALPPLIVFSKGLPAGRNFHEDGPVNAAYSHSDSGFVDRAMYTDWFKNVFLKFAPAERPLILLQDGASAHMGIDLIDAAIASDVTLLCFPPKLTHILQPCDVGIYKKMKAEVAQTMRQVRMFRGDQWVNKGKVPAVFREVFDRTFTPLLIKEAFRKCGIYPLNRNAVEKEHIMTTPIIENSTMASKTLPSAKEACIENISASGHIRTHPEEVIIDLTLDVVSPSGIPAGSEVILTDETETSRPCPPSIALDAVEMALTPRKKASYILKDSQGIVDDKDPVYGTWRYLKHKVNSLDKSAVTLPQNDSEHPLVTAGLIPRRLVDVFRTPPTKEKRVGRGVTKARVITSDELSTEMRKRDSKRKADQREKEERKRARLEKRKQDAFAKQQGKRRRVSHPSSNKENTQSGASNRRQVSQPAASSAPSAASRVPQAAAPSATGNRSQVSQLTASFKSKRDRVSQPTAPHKSTERQRYFVHLQSVLRSCSTYSAMKAVCPRELPYPLPSNPPSNDALAKVSPHQISQTLLSQRFPTMKMKTVDVLADGNCLARSGSFILCGTEVNHKEVRVRLVQELLLHDDYYLNDDAMSHGNKTGTKMASTYAQFSPGFVPGTRIDENYIQSLYESEVLHVIQPNTYCGMWQLHSLSSVLGSPVYSLFPGQGAHKKYMCKIILPRIAKSDRICHILWTSTVNPDAGTWWDPNHFVPAFPLEKRVKTSQGTTKPSHVNDDTCAVCGDEFRNSRDGEIWVQCQWCMEWAHQDCTATDGQGTYLCDKCED